MIFQIKALQKVIAFLEENKIPFVIIGGIANAERGRPRATEDADLKVLIQGQTISEFRQLAERRFPPHRRPWLGKIEGILIRQRGKLDVEYIQQWLTQFSEALENPEILTRFNQLYNTI